MNAIAVNAMAPRWLGGAAQPVHPVGQRCRQGRRRRVDHRHARVLERRLVAAAAGLGLTDTFLTPDLRESGPMGSTYRLTFWVAATLAIVLVAVQAGLAAFRRDATSLGRLFVGAGQFLMVWAAWISYVLALVYACSGLTKAVMRATLGVDSWARGNPGEVGVEDLSDGTLATVLGVMGFWCCSPRSGTSWSC